MNKTYNWVIVLPFPEMISSDSKKFWDNPQLFVFLCYFLCYREGKE